MTNVKILLVFLVVTTVTAGTGKFRNLPSFSSVSGERCLHVLQSGCSPQKNFYDKPTQNFYSVTTGKRCVNLFDEGCANGGIPGAGDDEDWLHSGSPGKRNSYSFTTGRRCVNLFDEGCANGGLPGANADEDWLNNGAPGKRCIPGLFGNCEHDGKDDDWFEKAPVGKRNLYSAITGKRCVNLFDEGCANGGIPGAGDDEDWLHSGSPGKRNLYSVTTGRRCVNLFDEGCANGGLPGANADEDWLNNGAPGKRCIPGLFGNCEHNGKDDDWFEVAPVGKRNFYSTVTGKRCVNLFDEGCANGGIPGANDDEDWLHNGAPGKRCTPNLFGNCGNGESDASQDEDHLNNGPGKK